MAFRLGDYVVYGELRNVRNYSTFGVIALRGEKEGDETVLHLELTGNCAPDLQGKCFRFMPSEDDPEKAVFPKEENRGLRPFQIGPTGHMTAQGWVKTLPCPVEEFLQRARLGEPPPTEWKRHLHLEWYSQNGRVLVEMAGAVIEECTRQPENDDDEGDWAPIPNLAPLPTDTDEPPACGPGFTVVKLDGDTAHIEHWVPSDEKDPLQRELDREAAAVEREIRDEDLYLDGELPPEMTDYELYDYCLDHCEERPVGSLLPDVGQLPAPEDLDDEEVEGQLKALLGQMALIGVALDVCEHYSPRDCYTLLREHILPKNTVYKEMIGTGFMQHYCTYEHCPACEAEFDAKLPQDEGLRDLD